MVGSKNRIGMMHSDIREFAENILNQFGNVPNPISMGLIKEGHKQSCIKRIQAELSLLKENDSTEEDGNYRG